MTLTLSTLPCTILFIPQMRGAYIFQGLHYYQGNFCVHQQLVIIIYSQSGTFEYLLPKQRTYHLTLTPHYLYFFSALLLTDFWQSTSSKSSYRATYIPYAKNMCLPDIRMPRFLMSLLEAHRYFQSRRIMLNISWWRSCISCTMALLTDSSTALIQHPDALQATWKWTTRTKWL